MLHPPPKADVFLAEEHILCKDNWKIPWTQYLWIFLHLKKTEAAYPQIQNAQGLFWAVNFLSSQALLSNKLLSYGDFHSIFRYVSW